MLTALPDLLAGGEGWVPPPLEPHPRSRPSGPRTSDIWAAVSFASVEKNPGIADYYKLYGSTVNVCALDLSKAFDEMNHHRLFVNLMERHIPVIAVILLTLLERRFTIGMTCIK